MQRPQRALTPLVRSVSLLAVVPYLFCALGIVWAATPKPPKVKSTTAPPARKGRATLVIDGIWKFAVDHGAGPADPGRSLNIPPDARETVIPSLWTSSAAPNYSGAAWYWRVFAIPAEWKGQTIRVRFHAVADEATVWLNGTLLGSHNDGATPFEFNITKTASIGKDNLIAVRVQGSAKRGAGIWQGVEVLAHDEAYIDDVYTQADAFGRITAEIRMLNTSQVEGDATLDTHVATISEPIRQVQKSNQNVHLVPRENLTSFLTSVHGKDLQLWTPDTPVVYGFDLIFRQDKDLLDRYERQFGFRSFGLKAGHITLNGNEIALSAIAPKLDLPVVIATSDDVEKARDMLQRAKRVGVSVIYLAAPPDEMLRLADVTGMLIVEGPRPGLSAAQRDIEMRELVLRDRSHPSVLAWNAGACSDAFARELRLLDSTRFLLNESNDGHKLWAPGRNAPETGPLPDGLQPVN